VVVFVASLRSDDSVGWLSGSPRRRWRPIDLPAQHRRHPEGSRVRGPATPSFGVVGSASGGIWRGTKPPLVSSPATRCVVLRARSLRSLD